MERPLHCYAYLHARFDLVSRVLAYRTADVLQHATENAAEQAGELSRTLSVEVGGFRISRDVAIEIGEFEPRGVMSSVVPLRWRAESSGLLFPTLSAELEIAALTTDPPLTQLTVDGSYVPPLGVVGAGADRLLLHRVAEATLHRFTNDVAEQLDRFVQEIPADERW